MAHLPGLSAVASTSVNYWSVSVKNTNDYEGVFDFRGHMLYKKRLSQITPTSKGNT